MTDNTHNRIEKIVDKKFPDFTISQKKKLVNKIESMPVGFRKRYVTAMSGRSRSVAMEYFCLECMGYTYDDCDCFACSLYPYRKPK